MEEIVGFFTLPTPSEIFLAVVLCREVQVTSAHEQGGLLGNFRLGVMNQATT